MPSLELVERAVFWYNRVMKEKITSETTESKEYKEKFGCDTHLRAIFVRHAQKRSGEILSKEGGLSVSSISEKGEKEAERFGEEIGMPARDGRAGRISESERTGETLENIEKGCLKLNEKGKRFKTRIRAELYADGPDKWEKIYGKEFNKNKKNLLVERGLKVKDFSKLSPDEQEEIAEAAEEPVVEEWLFDKKSKIYQAYPPEYRAVKRAVLIWQYIRMPDKFYSGSELDIFNATHKTVTEPLLAEILVLPNGKKIKSLQEIGGSLGTLDSWELDISNDEEGNKDVKLLLRRKMQIESGKIEFKEEEYDIDLKRLEELARRGIELNKKEREEKEEDKIITEAPKESGN